MTASIHDAPDGSTRILVPVTASGASLWGCRYALNRFNDGAHIEVILLNVGQRITDWRVLQYRTHEEILKFQEERATAFIKEASQPLLAAGITCRGIFKHGDVVRTIFDTADELECDRIIIPQLTSRFLGLICRGTRSTLLELDRLGRIVEVDRTGNPAHPPTATGAGNVVREHAGNPLL
jgi:hypothetical protein